MTPDKLARVRWQVGQTILPEHFHAQEDALSGESRLYAGFSGLPQLGIARLKWKDVLLPEGVLDVSTMAAVMPGGFLVEVPGNAFIEPFSLEETGRAEATVYLHLLEETRGAEGVPMYLDDPETVHRELRVLRLSADQVVDGAASTLELATFRKDPLGKWKLSEQEVPPLLLVGSHPFLDGLLKDLDVVLDQALGQLRTHIQDSYLRSDRLANARRALCEVRAVQALREDMNHGVYPTSYQFFAMLRRLYFEVCCYLEADPDERLPAYQHEDLGTGLRRWMELLLRSFRPEGTRLTHKPFAVQDGRFVLSAMPKEDPPPNDFYLLVQRKDPSRPLPLQGMKLASPLRLPVVRRLALKGIPWRAVPHPSFPHAFGPEIDWYHLTAEGEEWQYALRENGLSFYSTSDLEGAQVSLFWRRQ